MNTEDKVREAIEELLACEKNRAEDEKRFDNAEACERKAEDKLVQVIKASYGAKGEVLHGGVLYRVQWSAEDGTDTLEMVKTSIRIV